MSNDGNRTNMKAESRRRRFILRYGQLGWGLPFGVTMAILYQVRESGWNLAAWSYIDLIAMLFIFSAISILAGRWLFGPTLWWGLHGGSEDESSPPSQDS